MSFFYFKQHFQTLTFKIRNTAKQIPSISIKNISFKPRRSKLSYIH